MVRAEFLVGTTKDMQGTGFTGVAVPSVGTGGQKSLMAAARLTSARGRAPPPDPAPGLVDHRSNPGERRASPMSSGTTAAPAGDRSPRALARRGLHALARAVRAVDQRQSRRRAYWVPTLVTAAIVASWFRAGHFFAIGDIAPFERGASVKEFWSIWNHQVTAAGSPAYGIAQLPEYAVALGSEWFGLGPEFAQRTFYALVAGAVVASCVYFSFAFTDRAAVAAACGLLGFFNVFVLQHLPNTLTPWAIMVMALLGGLILRAGQGRGRERRLASAPSGQPRAYVFGLATIPASFLALNPPLLVIVIAWVATCVAASGMLFGRAALHRAARLTWRGTPWAIVLNAWWAVPYIFALIDLRSSFNAETSVDGWSWTHARNNLANVVSLSAHWGWRIRDYFPYAERLESLPFGLLKFALPALAGSALVLARRSRRQVLALLAIALPAVLLAKGLHPPLTGLNRFLYHRAPAMYLFREPYGKFGLVVLMVLLGLAALGLHAITERRRTGLRAGVPIALLAAALAYPVPLWTGEVIKEKGGVLPSAHVALPDEWRQVAAHLDGSGRVDKVLVLPLDDFYMMPTTWGFYGTDVIPRLLIERTTIQPLAEGYFGDPPTFRDLVERTEEALGAQDVDQVPRLLDALGVSDIVLRKDIDHTFAGRRLGDPEPLARALSRTPGVTRQLSTSVADVYSRSDGQGTVYLASATVGVVEEDDTPPVVGASPRPIVVRPTVGSSAPGRVLRAPDRRMTLSGAPGAHLISRKLVNGLVVRLALRDDPPTTLVVEDGAPVELDGQPVLEVPQAELELPAGGQWAATAAGRLVSFDGGPAGAVVKPGDLVATFDTSTGSTSSASFSEVGDCHAWDARTPGEAGIRGEVPVDEPSPAIRLEARAHAACARLGLPEEPPVGPVIYRLRFDYRTLSGRPARICVYHRDPQRCDPLPALAPTGDWTSYDQVFGGVPGAEPPELFVYADGDSPDGATTVTEYRGVVATAHRPYDRWRVPIASSTAVELSGERQQLRVRVPNSSPTTELSEAKDCHAVDDRPLEELGIAARPMPGAGLSVRLEAREHIGCVTVAVSDNPPATRYRVSLEHRSASGRPARLCLYQEGPSRCVPMPALGSDEAWRRFDQVVRPEPDARSLNLFLYADGDGGELTTVEYRNVRVEPVAPFDVVVVPISTEEGRRPALAWKRTGSAAYSIEVPASDSRRTVVLTESFSPLWKASTTPAIEVRHFEANGYANAWELPAGPGVVLEVMYAPNRAFVPLVALSTLAAGVGARSRLRAAGTRMRCAATALRRYARARSRARSR